MILKWQRLQRKGLEDVGANIIGAVLNKFEAEGNGYNYYNYYYQHESGRKGRNKKKAAAL